MGVGCGGWVVSGCLWGWVGGVGCEWLFVGVGWGGGL